MFQAQVASTNDVTSAFWNPAGLSGIVDAPLQVSAMHAEWFGGVANYDYLGVAKQINEEKNSYAAISLVRMGIDNIPYTLNLIGPDGSVNYDNVTDFSSADYAFFGSYGQKFGDYLRVGGSAKVIYRTIGTYNSWSFNFTEEEKQVFAATGNSIPVTSSEIALPRVVLGFAFHSDREDYTSKFSYLVEANFNLNTDGRASGIINTDRFAVEPAIGGEFGYNQMVYLRAGVGNMQRLVNDFNAQTRSLSVTPSVGLGLKLNRFKIDYALNNIGTQSSDTGALYSHIFSLTIDFVPKTRLIP
jgi:hypothetical protein